MLFRFTDQGGTLITAADILHSDIPRLNFDATIDEAVVKMRSAQHGWLAVMAGDDRIHGVLTEGGLMRAYLRFQTQKERSAIVLYKDCLEPGQLIQKSEIFPDLVKKIMSSVGNRCFVIGHDSKIIGYITAKDLLPFFTTSSDTEGATPSVVDEGTRSALYMYESFFSKSPFLMHSVNKEGTIIMANEILHSVLGYEYGDLIGKTIFDLYPKEAHKYAEEGLKTIFQKGYHKVVQSKMVHRNKTEIPVELVSRVLTNQLDQVIGTMTVSRPLDMETLLKALPQL